MNNLIWQTRSSPGFTTNSSVITPKTETDFRENLKYSILLKNFFVMDFLAQKW